MNFVQTPSFKLAIYEKGDRNAQKLALVLPGRLDTKDYVHMTSHVDFLAEQGFHAISFDMPGTWESPGNLSDYTTTNYIKIVNELIEQFGNKPTLLLGHSRGGSVSILAGATNNKVIGVIPIMATYGEAVAPNPETIKEGVSISYRDLPPGSARTPKQKKFELPLNYFEDAKKYNPAQALKSYKGPKLLIYGADDSFTPIKLARRVFDSLSEPKMFLELNTDHDYRYHPEMIQKVNIAVSEFLRTGVK